MSLDHFDYDLPASAIAQTPVEPRDSARLLDAIGDEVHHRVVRDLPTLIRPGDLIVVNETRVLPARLGLRKPTGGAVEVMLLEPADAGADGGPWRALVRPGRRVPPGTRLGETADGDPILEVGDDLGDGIRLVHATAGESMLEVAAKVGAVPLPPYITAELTDTERYQTVYSRTERSVAAPTAGLHFTPELIEQCRAAGAEVAQVELAVGLGTFRPVMVDDIDDHRMHAERYRVPPEVLDACASAARVIAIGTTTVRALESAATSGELTGSTELFISPGYDFKLVDALLTNFHQPRSSLLVMLSAFAGDRWRELYAEARSAGYRFLSFGDAMIVSRAA